MLPKPRLKRLWRSPLFLIGAALFLVGSGPLLVFELMDLLGSRFTRENPNPVLLGCMAMFSFIPSLAIMLVSIAFWLVGKEV